MNAKLDMDDPCETCASLGPSWQDSNFISLRLCLTEDAPCNELYPESRPSNFQIPLRKCLRLRPWAFLCGLQYL